MSSANKMVFNQYPRFSKSILRIPLGSKGRKMEDCPHHAVDDAHQHQPHATPSQAEASADHARLPAAWPQTEPRRENSLVTSERDVWSESSLGVIAENRANF
jgi:hypothetical protein